MDEVITLEKPIPILRIFDEDKAKDFYFNFLEFKLDWEHRYEDKFPLYMQISKGRCVIHLSEHHGDCSPGGALRIGVNQIELLQQKLLAKKYKFARPGLNQPNEEVIVTDPFYNKLIFYKIK